MYYFLGNKEDIAEIAAWLEEQGCINSNITPSKQAVGICTTLNSRISSRISDEHSTYTYLHNGNMIGTDPHSSWIMCRTECKSKDDFKNKVLEKIAMYK